MKEHDKARFSANISWFNQFFDGINQLYEVIFELLPKEFSPSGFALSSGNYYFPRLKIAPYIPPYYAFMVASKKWAMQAVAVIDEHLFVEKGPFMLEPSLVIVVHNQADKYGWINQFALKVIKNEKVELNEIIDGVVWGKIKAKIPADFFTFQVQYDKFTERDLKPPVQQYIINPVVVNLKRGI